MIRVLIFLILLSSTSIYSQQTDSVKQNIKDTANIITIVVTFDKNTATKDGYYLGGYVIDLNINPEQAKRLNGKRLKITGKLFIEKGLANQPKEYNNKGEVIIKQGRAKDTKHILSPTFKIIEE